MDLKPGQYIGMVNDVTFDGEGDKFHIKVQFNIIDLKGRSVAEFATAYDSGVGMEGVDLTDTSTQRTWFSYFRGGARAITVETLAKMGCTDINKVMEGKDGFNLRPYGLTLKFGEGDYASKLKISSIWIPGQGGFGSKLDRGAVQAQLVKLGLNGELAKAAQGVPVVAQAAKVEGAF